MRSTILEDFALAGPKGRFGTSNAKSNFSFFSSHLQRQKSAIPKGHSKDMDRVGVWVLSKEAISLLHGQDCWRSAQRIQLENLPTDGPQCHPVSRRARPLLKHSKRACNVSCNSHRCKRHYPTDLVKPQDNLSIPSPSPYSLIRVHMSGKNVLLSNLLLTVHFWPRSRRTMSTFRVGGQKNDPVHCRGPQCVCEHFAGLPTTFLHLSAPWDCNQEC